MTFWQFLKDRKDLLICGGLFMLVTVFMLWLLPEGGVRLSDALYLVLIQFSLLVMILVFFYLRRKNWWGKFTDKKQDSPLQHYLTGAKSNEEHLIQDYINQQVQEHQQLMQDVVASQKDQKEFIDSWIHEIKVPLAAVDLIMHSIEFDIDDEKYTLMQNELGKIDSYVEQVLYYARLDSFSRDYLIQEYSLKEITQPVISNQANYFIQKRLRLETIGEDQKVLTDSKWVGFIFQQILSNAIKYTPENGTIKITYEQRNKGVELAIADSGIGIPKEDLGRIFDKGFTGANGRLAEQHSTGLGLFLAKNLAEKLGIELSIESEQGKGTTVRLFFPTLTYYDEKR